MLDPLENGIQILYNYLQQSLEWPMTQLNFQMILGEW